MSLLDNFFNEEIAEPKLKDFKVISCNRQYIKQFIQKHHYSKSINGCVSDYCFALMRGSEMIGAMFYGKLAMANQYKRFAEEETDVTELRRLVCIDDTPKNTESYFIGQTLKWLNKNTTIKVVVSYADAEHGHSGVIYRASNFQYWGLTKGAKVIVKDGKRYHDKSIRTYHNNKLKPFAVRLIAALEDGTAEYKETLGKHTYVYYLNKRDRKNEKGKPQAD